MFRSSFSSFRRSSTVQDGFTLIELLVVVAIIALLISILLPSLSRAREQARTIKCAANEKQMGAANHMYADSQDNWYVPIYVVQPYNERWWSNEKYQSIMGMAVGEPWPDGLHCPTAPLSRIDSNNVYPHQTFGGTRWSINCVYGFNRTSVHRQNGAMALRRTSIQSPASTLQLLDATGWRTGHGSANYEYWDAYGDWVGRDGSPWNRVAYRHSEGANALHHDGHVERYAKEVIGDVAWQGDETPYWFQNYQMR